MYNYAPMNTWLGRRIVFEFCQTERLRKLPLVMINQQTEKERGISQAGALRGIRISCDWSRVANRSATAAAEDWMDHNEARGF